MARKKNTLLTEGEMRRFMKLANISPINEMGDMYAGGRDEEEETVDEMYHAGARDDEEDMDMEVEDDMGDDMDMEVEDDMGDDMDMEVEDDMGDDMDMDMDMGGEDTVTISKAEAEEAIEDFIGRLFDEPTDVDYDAGDEVADDEGGDSVVEPTPDMDDMDDMGDDMEDDMDDMEALAEQIAKRVRRRLVKESKRKKAKSNLLESRIDELTEKIFKRIVKESR